MSNAKQHLKKKWRMVLTISVLFLVLLVVQDVVREVVLFNRNVEILEVEFQRDTKDDVSDLVHEVENDFSLQYENITPLAIEHAKEHSGPLLYAAQTVQTLMIGESLSTIQDTIVDMVQSYNIDDQQHIFAVYDTDGFILYDGFENSIVHTDMSTATDALNRPYVSSLLDEVIQSDSNEASMLYYRLEDELITSYVLYGVEIDSTNLIVVGFVQIERFTEFIKEEAIAEISEKFSDQINSVYVLSGDGEVLYHQNTNAIGITIDDENYPLWQETLGVIYDFVEQNQEGFLEYPFYSNYENGVIEDKIAYLYYLNDWDIIIGASTSSNTYQSLLDDYVQDNYQTVLWIKIPAYSILLAMAFFIVWFIRKNINVSQELLLEDEQLYRTFADMTSEIIMITDTQGRIIFTNKKGTDIIFGKRQSEDDVFFDQILVEEDGYFILYGVKEDLFVKYITEPIVYNNKHAELYIIVNVTDKIKTKRQLEALSMKDDLTGLGNRRMLVHDYNQTVIPHVKANGTVHLVMLDLDDFKPANDLYGHTFGDEVLTIIARIFKEQMNDRIKIYRIGGDEFAMLLMDMTEQTINSFLQQLQQKIRIYPYERDIEVGFSGGVVEIELTNTKRRFSDFYDKADKLLYKSKDSGKNTIHF